MTEVVAEGFEIIRKLGSGGMGDVYLALEKNLERHVAIKVLRGDSADREMRKRFLLEAKAYARIRHPNVVAIHRVGQSASKQVFYIVMDFIEGKSLEERIETESPLDFADSAHTIIGVCKALSIAHAKGILHRDIKPSNILFDHDGTVKLTDFGLAKFLHEEKDISRTGQVVGTPHYMPPEQMEGKGTDERSDIFSAGATLYSMVTGQKPFDGSSVFEIISNKVQKKLLRPREVRKDLPARLEHIILRCMEYNPAYRFSSCDDLSKELESFLDDVDRPSAPRSPASIRRNVKQRLPRSDSLNRGHRGMEKRPSGRRPHAKPKSTNQTLLFSLLSLGIGFIFFVLSILATGGLFSGSNEGGLPTEEVLMQLGRLDEALAKTSNSIESYSPGSHGSYDKAEQPNAFNNIIVKFAKTLAQVERSEA